MKCLALLFLLTVASAYAGNNADYDPMERYGHLVGTFDGAGHLRMKPGFALHSETRIYRDECGYLRAVDHYYLTYRGRRFTD